MTSEIDNLKPNKLFDSINSIFKKIGFAKQQIITMDITAGAYLVTNPTDDLPRVICSLTEDNELKIEYSQFSKSNLDKFTTFLSGLRTNALLLVEGQLVDTSSGSNLEEFEIEGETDFDFAAELLNIVLEYPEILTTLKFYITFDAKHSLVTEQVKGITSKVDTKDQQNKRIEFEDEIAIILNFISKRTTKCIQSKHLLELYPQSTKKECLKKLKLISERGYLTQSGPWFLLNKR